MTPKIINIDIGDPIFDTYPATKIIKKKHCQFLKAEAHCWQAWSSSPDTVCFLQAPKETSCTLVTGFTAMTEKFSTAMYMDRGAEQLVEILNHYISAIAESKCF